MSNYVKSTNFASKDALATGNPLKIVKGTEIDTEFNNIATAVATKADLNSPALIGTPTAPTASAGTSTTQVATTSFVGTAVSNAITAYDTALTVSTSQIEDNAVTTAKIANSAVTAAKVASGVAVSNLGFTPVQQGTGTGQSTNTIKIGWNNSDSLLVEVDASNFGVNWPLNSRNGSRAWVNFNGTGTVAIRASHNVSSITDNGTGDYTVNFATALQDANYATVGLSKEDESNSVGGTLFFRLARFAQTSSAVRVTAGTAADGRIDPIQASVVVFR